MTRAITAELAGSSVPAEDDRSEFEQTTNAGGLTGTEIPDAESDLALQNMDPLEVIRRTYPMVGRKAFEAFVVSRQGAKLPTAARFWNTMHHLISHDYLDPRVYFPKLNLPNTIDLPQVRERIRMIERGEVFLHELGPRFWNSLADVNNALVINPEEVILPWDPDIHTHYKCHPCPATRRAGRSLAARYALLLG